MDNLKPFQKGTDERRNVSGKNKKSPGLAELLADVLSQPSKGTSTANANLIALKNKAIKGDIKAAVWLFERANSKAKQSVQQEVDVSIKDAR